MSFGFGRSSGPGSGDTGPQSTSFPSSTVAPQSPSPRTFATVVNTPSSVAPRYSQPFVASNRVSAVQWGDGQRPISGGFGNPNQGRSFPNHAGTSVSPKVSPSHVSGSAPQFPNPRTFAAVVNSPSLVPPDHSQPYVTSNRNSSVQWGDRQQSISGGFGDHNRERSFPNHLSPNTSSKVSPSQVLESSRRPPIQYNDDFLNEPINDSMEGPSDNIGTHPVASQRRQSPFPAVASNHSTVTPITSLNKPQRVSSAQWGDRQTSASGGFDNLNQERSFLNNAGTSVSSKVSPSQVVGTARRSPVQYSDDFLNEPIKDSMEGPSVSPPKSNNRAGAVNGSQYSQRIPPSFDGMNGDSSGTRFPSHPVAKRTRSPPAASGQIFLRSAPSTEDDTEREEQAKAKRLARFRTELDEVEPSVSVQRGSNAPQNKTSLKSMETKNSMEDLSMEYDGEDSQSSNIIVGMCPDMCPESERGERERKGDLDRYERLDGDRNHTNKTLAVKKYNRTAEREAELIRPMPILQKTMDYLLGLLDQPYDDRLLGLYNFLWDRMRAIRMDLRMQHIFNLKAITMLEQMIRLHVIAMHELCEFSKGEGFSEGFDAHLNIEQMNKTSVELFQLYDDHRKKGIFVPTEKEFRGYYALLKLDKHPGYKVEPAELSLDLAKMTAEIRQTPEILFARDVARSCRTGNFIAFFRHARKASYLQACLMHAHFSKLRTQALASLHSGLQHSQGLPVTHIARWLGMEGEDIESLLVYHGFSIKEFEEPYMVKDGPFLHDDKDYSTRCSTLVHRKKSSTIVEDISSSREVILPPKTSRLQKFSKTTHVASKNVQTESLLNVSVGGHVEIEAVTPSSGSSHGQPIFGRSNDGQIGLVPGSRIDQPCNDNLRVAAGSPRSNSRLPKAFASLQSPSMQEKPSPLTPKSSYSFGASQLSDKIPPGTSSTDQFIPAPLTPSLDFAIQDEFKGPIQSSPNIHVNSELNATPLSTVSVDIRELMPSDLEVSSISASSPKDAVFMEELVTQNSSDMKEEVENDDVSCNFDKEVAEAKLRLLLRLWRRRFVRKKKLNEENRLAANAALSSLSLGPPLWQSKEKLVHSPRLNIDKALHERYGKWQESLERWNVSDLVAAKLAEKNANSNCVCWKVISFSWLHHETSDTKARNPSIHLSLDEWLHYKLIPAVKDETVEGLAVSAPGLSVWRKWGLCNSGDTACYFSVVKDTTSGNSEINFVGASAILFPISETVPWDVQRIHLHKVAMSLPPEACIPLLILSGSRRDDVAITSDDIVAKLGLDELDKSWVTNYSIICLNDREDNTGRFHGYFSDQKLKDGLVWLASESRPQPILSCVTTRELASLHLNLCLDALHLLGSDRVGPNQYISAFNEALDQAVNDIITASKANPNSWPCPEVFLLDDSSIESRAVKEFLPSLGWSSYEELEPLISAVSNCKLPYFSDDLSWLGIKGCNCEEQLEQQRQLLQDCLTKYLSQTSNMMHWMMAAKEATLMVQNYTRLELHGTEFKMVPSWMLILRRVFNWQLNSAASFAKKAYVLEKSISTCSSPQLHKSNMDVDMHHFGVHPSLDEMVEVSCSPIGSKRAKSSPKSLGNVAAITSFEHTATVTLFNHAFEENNHQSEILTQSVDNSEIHLVNNDLDMVTQDEKKDDRLSQLLNHCDILQNEIDRKLSIYF
ncbi:SAC3 family protein B isoform X2 [Silene latifolia]|uniref:SAC3 family protein B isoform X2 n=1 Tax=Silene latifolia TaxID=37657 RepID=UPI003D76B5CF